MKLAPEGTPWADLTSDQRLAAVLIAVDGCNKERYGSATGNAVAYWVMSRHRMRPSRHGNHGHGNVARAMAPATRVTPALTALRKRGLTQAWSRTDGLSGSADYMTPDGRKAVSELLEQERP